MLDNRKEANSMVHFSRTISVHAALHSFIVHCNDRTMLQMRRQSVAVVMRVRDQVGSCTNSAQFILSRSFLEQIPPVKHASVFRLSRQAASRLLPSRCSLQRLRTAPPFGAALSQRLKEAEDLQKVAHLAPPTYAFKCYSLSSNHSTRARSARIHPLSRLFG